MRKRIAWILACSACAAPGPAHVDVAAPTATASVTPVASALPPVATAAPLSNGCIVVDEEKQSGETVTLEGRVSCGEHSHPNGSMFHFCALVLDAPRCVHGLSDSKTVSEVQLASGADAQDAAINRLVDQRIRVTGDPFPALTAWHVRPVVLMVKEFSRRPN
ncbi:MAG TPA: DUF4431 domain-containing protein [Polyangiaceae bacterium]|jgi:hypothetical protein